MVIMIIVIITGSMKTILVDSIRSHCTFKTRGIC